MHFNIALLLSVLAQATTSTAACTSTASHSLTKRLHDVALKHSAGLAKDLRTAFGGVLVNRQPSPVSGSKLRKRNAYCISQRGSGGQVPLGGNGNGTTTHRPSSTSTSRSSGASPTSTGSGAAPSATSNWKLVESHVSCEMLIATKSFVSDHIDDISKVLISSRDGISSLEAIQRTGLWSSLIRDQR